VPFIAETGGINAMIVDCDRPARAGGPTRCCTRRSYSAGQRCSALRLLFVQDDVADKIIDMLKLAPAAN
jgi:RHH-type proline utilization regulon transcriptional repressor/proline dehydrogenase/delta 1-pyrroline-5-carboxylate dehydrogenase